MFILFIILFLFCSNIMKVTTLFLFTLLAQYSVAISPGATCGSPSIVLCDQFKVAARNCSCASPIRDIPFNMCFPFVTGGNGKLCRLNSEEEQLCNVFCDNGGGYCGMDACYMLGWIPCTSLSNYEYTQKLFNK
jgi:hypothetical protein